MELRLIHSWLTSQLRLPLRPTSQLRLLPLCPTSQLRLLCPTSQLRHTLLGITALCLGESREGSLCTRLFVRATRPFIIT